MTRFFLSLLGAAAFALVEPVHPDSRPVAGDIAERGSDTRGAAGGKLKGNLAGFAGAIGLRRSATAGKSDGAKNEHRCQTHGRLLPKPPAAKRREAASAGPIAAVAANRRSVDRDQGLRGASTGRSLARRNSVAGSTISECVCSVTEITQPAM